MSETEECQTGDSFSAWISAGTNLSLEDRISQEIAYHAGYLAGARAAIAASAALIDLGPSIRKLLAWIDNVESR